jgi:hypothetical protein
MWLWDASAGSFAWIAGNMTKQLFEVPNSWIGGRGYLNLWNDANKYTWIYGGWGCSSDTCRKDN